MVVLLSLLRERERKIIAVIHVKLDPEILVIEMSQNKSLDEKRRQIMEDGWEAE